MTAIPFRADHVGSLLRPPRLHDARAAAATGRIDADELTQIEDDCIREVVRQQEALGLDVVTDGEFRRSWCRSACKNDPLRGVIGVEK